MSVALKLDMPEGAFSALRKDPIVPDKVYQEVTAKGAVDLSTIKHLK